jgi:hypothetical protein
MDFDRRFSTEKACRRYLVGLRWPDGFVCPRCAGKTARPMNRRLLLCRGCRYQVSVAAGTIFQDSHLPLTTWFRAMWHVTSQKNGVSAVELQRLLGLGSYKTAWAMLHKLRRAMVPHIRDRLRGVVELDETCWGGGGDDGWMMEKEESLVVVAVEERGIGIGRIRLCRVADLATTTLHGFIVENIDPGSTVRTDGLPTCLKMDGYIHDPQVRCQHLEDEQLLPRVNRVVSLLRRWLRDTHRGAVGHQYLDYYLDEFTFRFNRRKSQPRSNLFYCLAQQAVQVEPVPFVSLRSNHNP